MQLNQKQVKKVDKSWVVKEEPVQTDKKEKKRLNTDQNRRNQQRGRNMQTRSEREV